MELKSNEPTLTNVFPELKMTESELEASRKMIEKHLAENYTTEK